MCSSDLAIAKRMGWHYSEAGRVRAALETYNKDGSLKEKAPEPPPAPKPTEAPKPEETFRGHPTDEAPKPEPPKVDTWWRTTPGRTPEDRKNDIARAKQELSTKGITLVTPSSISDPNSPHYLRDLNAVHTGCLTTMEAIHIIESNGGTLSNMMSVDFERLGNNTYAHASHMGKMYGFGHDIGGGHVSINLEHPSWQSVDTLRMYTNQDARTGFHPSGEPHSIVIHELGHVLHTRNAANAAPEWSSSHVTKWELKPTAGPFHSARQIASQVSRYAMENPKEFVAEVYAGSMCGKTFNPGVCKLYAHLKGPKLKG